MLGPADYDYTTFDSRGYLNFYFGQLDSPNWPKGYLRFILDGLSGIYNSGKIKGSTILDFGAGPNIFSLISAARHFPNIYLSDFSENNGNTLWQWLNKDPGSHDFSHFLQYVIEKEQLGLSRREYEDDMRSRIRGILNCDMTLDKPLYPSIFPQFDVITSSLCLCAEPSSTLSGYEAAVKNVASLLKPGGWIIYIDALASSYYNYGSARYNTTCLSKHDVFESWKNSGVDVDTWSQFKFDTTEFMTMHDSKSIFYMLGRKKQRPEQFQASPAQVWRAEFASNPELQYRSINYHYK